MSLEPEKKDLIGDVVNEGVIVGREAGENIEPRDVKLVEEANSTPMFFNEKVRKGLRSSDNRRKARKFHKDRSDRSRKADNNQQNSRVFEDPISDKELETWKENPDEFDLSGIDTKDERLI